MLQGRKKSSIFSLSLNVQGELNINIAGQPHQLLVDMDNPLSTLGFAIFAQPLPESKHTTQMVGISNNHRCSLSPSP